MKLGKDAKVELISKVPLFSRCSKKELREIASAADEIDLPAGKVLTREGDRGREFFVLVAGSAEVRKGARKVRTLGAGDFLGEIALVTHVPRTATVTTTEPTRALVITDRSFSYLLSHVPKLERGVLQALADRLAPETL
ncbi:MAG TPA: cyclic nucleotide-binding domain-containing protein [Solirubrobacteraceae bacterium]